jgi:6-pyruvoyltetrahydropterin/6-carboxytetrahydropterin synthase
MSFSAAHMIEGHLGKCANLHGHNWDVEIHICSQELDSLGMAIDFAEIKAIVSPVVDELDHVYLNDLEYFKIHPPTAECVVRYIYESCKDSFVQKGVILKEVVIWETNGCGVKYSKGIN